MVALFAAAAAPVDRYGHALANLTKEEATTRTAMVAAEAARARAWGAADAAAYTPKKLKQLVRDGIPPPLRLRLWLQLSGGDALRGQQAPGYFAGLRARGVAKAFLLQVETCVLRALPGHQLLGTPFGLLAAATVAHAYGLHTGQPPRQATTAIAAFLVSIFGPGSEEDCFWVMAGLLGNVLPPGWAEEAAAGTLAEHAVLEQLLRRRAPRLLAALAAADCPLRELAGPWFARLFAGCLPAETAVRVWDCLLLEGPKILFRVALALLKREEGAVLGNPQKLRNLQWRCSRAFNADALLKVAFKGIGSLPSAAVAQARREAEAAAPTPRASQSERLQALLSPARISPQPSASSGVSELSTVLEEAPSEEEAPAVAPGPALAPLRVA